MNHVTPQMIGTFIDDKAGTARTVKSVAGRLIEEAAELGLAAGLTSGEIVQHIMDSIHNQCLKQSYKSGHVIFPSQITDQQSELAGEIVDVGWALKDLQYLCSGVDFNLLEQHKWDGFTARNFMASPNGTLYSIKPHMQVFAKKDE